jgi:phosphomannomutase
MCRATFLIDIISESDFGLAFDGDGDRIIAVDENGQIVDGDQIMFIIHFSLILYPSGLHPIVSVSASKSPNKNGASDDVEPFTHPEKLAEKVVETESDFGLAFDGDGDRIIAVDENGQIVDIDIISIRTTSNCFSICL